MKVVIKEIKSGKFYAQPGAWVEELEMARGFENSFEAFEHARLLRLEAVEVYHASRVPGMDFGVPVSVLQGQRGHGVVALANL